MSQPIIVVATVSARPGTDATTVEKALHEAAAAVQQEPGCEQYAPHRRLDDPSRWVILERWTDEAALATHSTAPAVRTLRKTLEGLADFDVVKMVALL